MQTHTHLHGLQLAKRLLQPRQPRKRRHLAVRRVVMATVSSIVVMVAGVVSGALGVGVVGEACGRRARGAVVHEVRQWSQRGRGRAEALDVAARGKRGQ